MRTEARSTRYLSPADAAVYLGLTERGLAEWRRTGRGPKYSRLGGPTGRVRYDVEELDRWMTEREFAHTSEESADLPPAA